jgi:NTP pyrophosphatase (non-canonical NTP hydrolase)
MAADLPIQSQTIMYNFEVMDIKALTEKMNRFVEEKGWYSPDSPRPQTPKNLALSLSIEAAEVLELFQWQDEAPDPQMLAGELADVTLYLLQLASVTHIDLDDAVLQKLAQNYTRTWDEDPSREENGAG